MIIGIDLGTTNSLTAIWKDGRAQLVPNVLGEYLTPSCVSLDSDGSILVGRAAKERLQTHPQLSASLFKRYMGTKREFSLGGRSFRPEELSSFVLRALKADAEALLGEPVEEAIITVPAYFSDSQRQATRVAGQLAGLKVERLLNEPTAAALAYGLHTGGDNTQFLVFDLGGGTFDVSILEMFEGVMEVRATAGDNYLGGEDVVDIMVQRFLRDSGLPARATESPAFMQYLAARAESVKRALSSEPEAMFSAIWEEQNFELPFDQAMLQHCCEPLLARLRMPVERALRDASLAAFDVDAVVLAGGATRMPLVRQLVTRMFGRFPAIDLNPDEVVAAGAAVMAGLKMKNADLREVVMTDVCPYSLGTSVSRRVDGKPVSGFYRPIIERNSVVPISRVESFWPVSPQQTKVNIDVYQGEARRAEDNILLGEFDVDITHLPDGERGFDLRFTYDVNGILEVEATFHHDGKTHRMVFQNNGETLSEAEVQERLAALRELKVHPRDVAVNKALMAQAERLFQQLLGEQRDIVGEEIIRFERALETQDPRRIGEARRKLHEVLRQHDEQRVFSPQFDE